MSDAPHPTWGPFLFDTSAESWLARHVQETAVHDWLDRYLACHQIHLSSITVLERVRGYARLARTVEQQIYLSQLGQVWPVDAAAAIVAGEVLALLPEPPTPPKRLHRQLETRASRISRWRFDAMIAATAVVRGLTLVHDNASDFEAIRSTIERSPHRFPSLGTLELFRITRILS